MPISEGFETYSVWMETKKEPVRDTIIENIYVFEKGKVNLYKMYDRDSGLSGVKLEDILDMSDKELIKFARETSEKLYDEYEKRKKNTKYFDAEAFKRRFTEVNYHYEEFFGSDYKDIVEPYFNENKPLTEDIIYGLEGNRPKLTASKYTLDLKIDDLGQHTESMKLIMPDSSVKVVHKSVPTGSMSLEDYIDFLYFNLDTIIQQIDDKAWLNEQKKLAVEELKRQGRFEAKHDGFELTHPQNFVPIPFTWEKEDNELVLKGTSFKQKIFDTTFSGLKTGNRHLFTRVDDSFVGFRLDSPDTKSKNVTIEGK